MKKHRNAGINFLDDYTHVSLFTVGKLHYLLKDIGYSIKTVGIARNIGYAALAPVMLPVSFALGYRPGVVVSLQNLIGLSIFAVAVKPGCQKGTKGWTKGSS